MRLVASRVRSLRSPLREHSVAPLTRPARPRALHLPERRGLPDLPFDLEVEQQNAIPIFAWYARGDEVRASER